jgi:hypothetical protein
MGPQKSQHNEIMSFVSVSQVIKMLQVRRMALLIPLMTTNGVLRAFIFGTFTQGVQKSLGKSGIGFVMMVFGITDAVSSLLLGRLRHILVGLFSRISDLLSLFLQ